MVATGGDNPVYLFLVHTELSRFLNCRTVVTLVELSFVDALLSKRRLEVHKSRVSLSYSWIYTHFGHVIIMSKESTSLVVLPS